MTFEEAKKKYEERFDRKLSDKEVAEIALNLVHELEDDSEAFQDRIESLEKQLSELKREMEDEIQNESVRMVAYRMEEIMDRKAKNYYFHIYFKEDEAPFVDYAVEGETIGEEEEDEDEQF